MSLIARITALIPIIKSEIDLVKGATVARADLDALATAGSLVPGRIYVLTDEDTIIHARTANSYLTVAGTLITVTPEQAVTERALVVDGDAAGTGLIINHPGAPTNTFTGFFNFDADHTPNNSFIASLLGHEQAWYNPGAAGGTVYARSGNSSTVLTVATGVTPGIWHSFTLSWGINGFSGQVDDQAEVTNGTAATEMTQSGRLHIMMDDDATDGDNTSKGRFFRIALSTDAADPTTTDFLWAGTDPNNPGADSSGNGNDGIEPFPGTVLLDPDNLPSDPSVSTGQGGGGAATYTPPVIGTGSPGAGPGGQALFYDEFGPTTQITNILPGPIPTDPDFTVSSIAECQSALASCTGGEVILFTAGSYGDMNLIKGNDGAQIRIVGDGFHAAQFSRIDISQCRGVSIEQLYSSGHVRIVYNNNGPKPERNRILHCRGRYLLVQDTVGGIEIIGNVFSSEKTGNCFNGDRIENGLVVRGNIFALSANDNVQIQGVRDTIGVDDTTRFIFERNSVFLNHTPAGQQAHADLLQITAGPQNWGCNGISILKNHFYAGRFENQELPQGAYISDATPYDLIVEDNLVSDPGLVRALSANVGSGGPNRFAGNIVLARFFLENKNGWNANVTTTVVINNFCRTFTVEVTGAAGVLEQESGNFEYGTDPVTDYLAYQTTANEPGYAWRDFVPVNNVPGWTPPAWLAAEEATWSGL